MTQHGATTIVVCDRCREAAEERARELERCPRCNRYTLRRNVVKAPGCWFWIVMIIFALFGLFVIYSAVFSNPTTTDATGNIVPFPLFGRLLLIGFFGVFPLAIFVLVLVLTVINVRKSGWESLTEDRVAVRCSHCGYSEK